MTALQADREYCTGEFIRHVIENFYIKIFKTNTYALLLRHGD